MKKFAQGMGLVGLVLAALLAWPTTAPAASGTWTNTSSGLWSGTTNWSGGIVADGSGNTADFSTMDITADVTNHLDSARTIGNLIFGDTVTTTNPAGWVVDNNGGGGNILTLDGGTPTITVNTLGTNNTKSTTISAVIAGTNGLTKTGVGTLNLTAANTYTGATTITAGTLTVGNGAAGSLNGTTGTPLTFTGTGTFNVNEASGVSQGLGALTFNGGDGTVQSTYGSGAGIALTCASLAARASGAAGNFVVSGGTNGTSNKIVFTAAPTASRIMDYGLFFGGSKYAAYAAGGYVRGLIYGTDNNAKPALTGVLSDLGSIGMTNDVQYAGTAAATTTTGNSSGNTLVVSNSALFAVGQSITGTGIPANSFVVAINNATNLTVGGLGLPWQTNGFSPALSVSNNTIITPYNAVTNQPTGSLDTLNLAGSGAAVILTNGATLTVNGLLRSGDSTAIGSISGGTGIQADLNKDLVIRTDTANDALIISSPILSNGVNNLVKSGAGQLTLFNSSDTANTYTGKTFVNGGTLAIFRNNTGGTPPVNLGAVPASFQADNIVLQNGATIAFNNNLAPLKTLTFEANRGLYLGPGLQTIERVGDLALAINGAISGPGGLIVKYDSAPDGGGGNFDLNAANTYVGDTVFAIVSGQTKAWYFRLGAPLALQNSTFNFDNLSGFTDAKVYLYFLNITNATLGGLKGGILGTARNIALVMSNPTNTSTPLVLSVGNNNQNTTYAGTLSGSGALIKIGTGALTLSGASTYTGTTTLSNGVLVAGYAESAGASGPFGNQAATNKNTIVFAGGTLRYSSANHADYSGRFSTNANQAIRIDTAGTNVTFGAALVGSNASLTKLGAGTLTLAATNTYTGATTVSNGNLKLTSPTALTTNTSVYLSGGTLYLATGTNKVTALYINGFNEGNGVFGSNSFPSSITGGGCLQIGEGPPAPTDLTAVGVNTHVLLQWTGATNATGYKVYQATTNGGPYSVVGTTNATSYLDTGLFVGTTYYYRVSATNSGGESAKSDQDSATTLALTPPAFLPGSGVSVNSGTGATIKFGATNGVQYRIVYKDDLLSTNNWLPVAPVWQTATNTAPMTITDPGATNSVQRFYRIEAQ